MAIACYGPDIARALTEGSINDIDPAWISLISESDFMPHTEG